MIVITPIDPVKGMGAEEAAPSLFEFPVIDPEPAAHAARIFGVHVGIDEIREIGNAVLGRHLPKIIEILVLPVKVLGDVIGRDWESENPSLRVPFCHHLQEGLVEEIHLVLEFLVGFLPDLAPDDHVLVGIIFRHGDIERDIGERRLEPDPGRDIDIENEFLEGLLDLLEAQTVVLDKGGEQGVEIGEGLRTGGFSLQGVKEIDDLAQGAAEVLGRQALDLAGGAAEAFPQEVLEIPADAIDRQETQVMDMEIPFGVRLLDLGGIDFIEPVNLAHLGRDIIVQALQ